jgi:hypothetical protein
VGVFRALRNQPPAAPLMQRACWSPSKSGQQPSAGLFFRSLLVGRLATRIAAAALSGRLLRAVAALPGDGGLISARLAFLPCARVVIGRLLLLLVVVPRHRVAVVLAGGRLPGATRILIRRRLLRAIAALAGRGRLLLIALLSLAP